MNENAIVPLADTMQLGEVLAKSGFFSDAKGAAQAVVKVLAGREMGFGPIASMTGVNIVQGKPSLGANLLGAAIKRTGKYNYRIIELTNERAEVAFFENGEEVGRSVFTLKDAQQAGLNGKDNWKKYPRNMLFSRAISNGARWYCPDVFGGVTPYTPEELGAEVNPETGEIVEAQKWEVEPEQEPAPAPAPELDLAWLSGVEPNPDLECLEWSEFAEATVKELGYNHPKHSSATLTKYLGGNWAKDYSKTQCWEFLSVHKQADAEA